MAATATATAASATAAAATAQPGIARAAATTLANKLLGHLQNRTHEAEQEAATATATATAAAAAGDVEGYGGDGQESEGIVSSSTPANYLSLYDEVASALDETQAAEEAGYALIDDISEWLLSAAGGNNLSLNAVGGGSGGETTPTSVSSSSSSGSPNETLSWLTLDMGDAQNTTLASSSSSSIILGSSSNNSSDADGDGGLYALRNFVEQQLNGGESSQDAQDIALIDSAEESALENVGDGEADYGLLSSFGGVSLDTDVDAAAGDLLQRTATRLRNRTTAAAAAAAGYDADALWLSGGGGGAGAGARAAGGAAGGAARASADRGGAAGAGAGNGGSSFMLLLENFNDYFPNYNGSTVSGTTVGTSTASSVLLDQNLTSLYIENYRNNCTNATLNMTSDTCPDMRVGKSPVAGPENVAASKKVLHFHYI